MAVVVTADGDYEGMLEGYDRSIVRLTTAKGNLIMFPWHVVLRVMSGIEAAEQPERFGFENMTRVADLVRNAVITDGAYHKQWYLERIAERLEVVLTPEHEDGIAP